ncbi:MAG: histidinol-phosphatase [Syntrophothermus sp.]
MDAELNNFFKYLAAESGKIIKDYFRKPITIDNKSDNSPVTIADKLAEEKLRELITKEFPQHGIIGEEFGSVNDKAEYKWIIDPIDGTKSFICGTITFGTLIALLKNDEPVLGCFNQPILGEFLIGDNSKTYLNDVQVYAKKTTELKDSILLTTDHRNIKKHRDIESFNYLIDQVKIYRNWGDCYGYYLLATGFADIMIDPIMSIWDTAAIIPLIKGAGGTITDYYGGDSLKGNSIIASATQELHTKVLEILN